jgi:hypothetical protein
MRTTCKLLALLILMTFSNCDSSKKMDYKYADNQNPLACDFPDGDLYKEAIYAFENDLINAYNPQKTNIAKTYTTFLSLSSRSNFKVEDIASEHSLNIAKLLKEDTSLWTTTNGVVWLNKSHPLVDCIANNLKDRDIKTTFNALLATNSLKPSLFIPLLSNNNSRFIREDGSLKSYLALELFYTKLLDVELEQLKNPNPEPQLEPAKPSVTGFDVNKVPTTLEVQ